MENVYRCNLPVHCDKLNFKPLTAIMLLNSLASSTWSAESNLTVNVMLFGLEQRNENIFLSRTKPLESERSISLELRVFAFITGVH